MAEVAKSSTASKTADAGGVTDDARAEALDEFGKAAAELPLDRERLMKAKEDIKSCGGDALYVEAIAICGMFHTITKIVDATGRQPLPSTMFFMMFKIIAKLVTWLGSCFS